MKKQEMTDQLSYYVKKHILNGEKCAILTSKITMKVNQSFLSTAKDFVDNYDGGWYEIMVEIGDDVPSDYILLSHNHRFNSLHKLYRIKSVDGQFYEYESAMRNA